MFIYKLKNKQGWATGMFRSGKFLALVLIVLLLSACSGGGGSSSDNTADPGTEGDLAVEATITEEPGPTVDLPPGSLGSASFNLDIARSQSVDYLADGQGVTLQATDAGGLTWTLEIPGDALMEPKTIKMTPLTAIAANTPGSLAGGILLEPDGLQFLSAAILKVTGPGAENYKLILTGNQDGSGLEFAAVIAAAEGAAAEIFHFSSYFEPSGDPVIQGYQAAALADFENAKIAALDLLKKPITVPPAPSVKYNCMGTGAYMDPEPMLKEYVEQVNTPERVVIARLLGAGRTLALLGSSSDEPIDLARKVQSRILKKVKVLITTYQPQPEKFAAVAKVALRAWRESALFGGESSPELLLPWAQKVRDHYINELRTNHDYSVIPALLPLARWAVILGDPKGYIEEIKKAMTFKVTFDNTTTAEGTGGYMIFGLHGDIDVKKLLTDKWEGTGQGEYVSFQAVDDVQMVMPNSFPVTVSMEKLDACVNKSVDVFVNTFGADTETFFNSNGASPGFVVKPLGLGLFIDSFVPAMNSFKFNLPLQNLQQEAAKEMMHRIMASDGTVGMDYELKLVHTPE